MTRFAQKTWRKVQRNDIISINDAGLVSAYDFKSGPVDLIASNDGTRYRSVDTGIKGLLGTAVSGYGRGNLRFGAGFSAQTQFFCSLWYKHVTTTGLMFIASQYADASNGFALTVNVNALSVYDDINNAGTNRYSVTLVNGCTYHILFGIDSDKVCKLWVNGVPSANNQAAALGFNSVGGEFYLGSRYNFSVFAVPGHISNVEVFNTAKTDTDAIELHSRGARAIQFATDWGHDADGITRGVPEYLGNGPFSVYFRTFKVTTDTVDGHLCKVIECVTPGNFFMPWSLAGVRGAETGYGSWSCWVYVPSGDAGDFVKWDLFNSARNPGVVGGSGYLMGADGAGTATIQERGVGNVVAGSNPVGQWVHLHGTRRYDGRFELFVNGVSQGTGTDTTVASGPYMSFDMTAGTKVAVAARNGGYAITKYLGVTPPRM